MHLTSTTSDSGVTQQLFIVDGVTGAFWQASDAPSLPRPVVLLGHGGGQHRCHPAVLARARRCVAAGFTAAALDAPGHGERPRTGDDERFTADLRERMSRGEPVGLLVAEHNAGLASQAVPEWRALLADLAETGLLAEDTPVGYWGMSLGGAIGVLLVAAEPRITAAVLGLAGHPGLTTAASRVTIPVEFHMQWDDEHVAREDGLALFDALGSAEKSLHANPGGHAQVPAFERESAERFLLRHLT
jgi:dienelactone hydrolase